MKKVTGLLILGLFVILSAMTVSAQVTIDTPAATASYVNSASDVVVNVTFNNDNAIWATFYISSDAGTTWTNVSNQTNGSVNDYFFNETILSGNFSTDNNYTLNVTVTMNNNTVATTSLANIVNLDTTNPVANLEFTDDDGNNLTGSLKLDYGEDMNINCTPTDATANIDISKTYVAVMYPGLTAYDNNLTLSTNSTTAIITEIVKDHTREIETFSVICFVQDNAGNSASTVLNFTTQSVVIGTGSSVGGSNVAIIEGWENPVGKIKIGSGTISDGGRLTTEGESRLMNENGAIKFDISGETHKIEVKAVTAEDVVLTISSEPFDVTIAAGESEEVDVNGDGVSDLEVTFHKLFVNTYADLTFKQISVPVEAEAVDEETSDVTEEAEEESEYVESKSGLTVTLAVIVIILIIGYALIKGKKK